MTGLRLLATAAAASYLYLPVQSLGVNCEGSLECDARRDTTQYIKDALVSFDGAQPFEGGEQLACKRIAGGGVCAFFQNTNRGTANQALDLIDRLISHGCHGCGSQPTDPSGNDVSHGELTVNFVTDPCGSTSGPCTPRLAVPNPDSSSSSSSSQTSSTSPPIPVSNGGSSQNSTGTDSGQRRGYILFNADLSNPKPQQFLFVPPDCSHASSTISSYTTSSTTSSSEASHSTTSSTTSSSTTSSPTSSGSSSVSSTTTSSSTAPSHSDPPEEDSEEDEGEDAAEAGEAAAAGEAGVGGAGSAAIAGVAGAVAGGAAGLGAAEVPENEQSDRNTQSSSSPSSSSSSPSSSTSSTSSNTITTTTTTTTTTPTPPPPPAPDLGSQPIFELTHYKPLSKGGFIFLIEDYLSIAQSWCGIGANKQTKCLTSTYALSTGSLPTELANREGFQDFQLNHTVQLSPDSTVIRVSERIPAALFFTWADPTWAGALPSEDIPADKIVGGKLRLRYTDTPAPPGWYGDPVRSSKVFLTLVDGGEVPVMEPLESEWNG
ncbi:MAG: hypothetical protein M1833_001468 [Piccolia ochrophora]|nr:MAG: hypothetical protein M1833_001468 [Piccolia ochrophora]